MKKLTKKLVPFLLVLGVLPAYFFIAQTSRSDETAIDALIARKLCDLQDARINESSGLAPSTRYANESLLWTHNDSGNDARIFCINLHGQTVAEVLLQGAANRDWEDMAVRDEWIYIGEIGDNLRRHDSVTIYRIREPEFDAAKIGQRFEIEPEKMTLKYPDGAHDCESLIVGAAGQVLLVTKNGTASKFFQAPRPFENGATQTLEQVGEYSFTGKTPWGYLATGGSLAPDEKSVVVRTYTHAYEWKVQTPTDRKKVFESKPRIFELPPSKQGEGICYSADGKRFFTTSEQLPAPLFEIENEE